MKRRSLRRRLISLLTTLVLAVAVACSDPQTMDTAEPVAPVVDSEPTIEPAPTEPADAQPAP